MRALKERAPLALFGVVLCVLFVGLGLLLAVAPNAKQAPLQWDRDCEHARQIAKEQKRPMVLLVTLPRCAACAQLERETLGHKSVKKALRHFVLARRELAPEETSLTIGGEAVPIEGTPTLLFFDADAQLVLRPRLAGYFRPQTFLRALATGSDRLFAPAAVSRDVQVK